MEQPAFPVDKTGGRWLGVVNHRWLKKNTLADPYPRIEDILTTMGRKKADSVFDLKEAFHQVPIAPRQPGLNSDFITEGLASLPSASPRTQERPAHVPAGS